MWWGGKRQALFNAKLSSAPGKTKAGPSCTLIQPRLFFRLLQPLSIQGQPRSEIITRGWWLVLLQEHLASTLLFPHFLWDSPQSLRTVSNDKVGSQNSRSFCLLLLALPPVKHNLSALRLDIRHLLNHSPPSVPCPQDGRAAWTGGTTNRHKVPRFHMDFAWMCRRRLGKTEYAHRVSIYSIAANVGSLFGS